MRTRSLALILVFFFLLGFWAPVHGQETDPPPLPPAGTDDLFIVVDNPPADSTTVDVQTVVDESVDVLTTSDEYSAMVSVENGMIVDAPQTLDQGVYLAAPDGSEALIDVPGAALADPATPATDGVVVYDGTDTSTSTAVQTTGDGVRFMTIISGPDAPSSYDFELTLSEGSILQLSDDGGADIINGFGEEILNLPPPWATDAAGNTVPVYYTFSGNYVTLHVDHAGAQYPVVADPAIQKINYYGKRAANYAKRYAPCPAKGNDPRDPNSINCFKAAANPFGRHAGNCTNFVSQAIASGFLDCLVDPQTLFRNCDLYIADEDKWWSRYDVWSCDGGQSLPWQNAGALYRYARNSDRYTGLRFKKIAERTITGSLHDLTKVKLGDVVFMDWCWKDRHWPWADHVEIVTAIDTSRTGLDRIYVSGDSDSTVNRRLDYIAVEQDREHGCYPAVPFYIYRPNKYRDYFPSHLKGYCPYDDD